VHKHISVKAVWTDGYRRKHVSVKSVSTVNCVNYPYPPLMEGCFGLAVPPTCFHLLEILVHVYMSAAAVAGSFVSSERR